jgi:hypothetical protein
MEELMLELLKMWLMKQVLGDDRPTQVIAAERGCSCGGGELDLDDMNDLDEGRPYIWNRGHAHDSC